MLHMKSIDRPLQPLRPSMRLRTTQPASTRISGQAINSFQRHELKIQTSVLSGCRSAFIWNIRPARIDIPRCSSSLSSEHSANYNCLTSETSQPRSEPPTSSSGIYQSTILKHAFKALGAMAVVLLTGLATTVRPASAAVDSTSRAAVVADRPLSTQSEGGKASTSGRQASNQR